MSLIDDLTILLREGKITEDEILSAISELRKPHPQINFYDIYCELNENIISQDSSLERIDIFNSLSTKAKEAVDYILEMLNPIAVRNRLDIILKRHFNWSYRETRQVISELREYACELRRY